jgi:hypothetical protein
MIPYGIREFNENAGMGLINPLYPPILGVFKSGGHPQTPGKK